MNDEPAATASALFADARRELADLPRDGLAEQRRSRWRGERVVRVGTAWRVGVLLIDDDAVYEVRDIVRAGDPGRRGYTADSARQRAGLRLQALRGGFTEGDVVHFGWTPIDVAAVDAGGVSGPLAMRDGEPVVRWSRHSGYVSLDGYLREAIVLLRRGE